MSYRCFCRIVKISQLGSQSWMIDILDLLSGPIHQTSDGIFLHLYPLSLISDVEIISFSLIIWVFSWLCLFHTLQQTAVDVVCLCNIFDMNLFKCIKRCRYTELNAFNLHLESEFCDWCLTLKDWNIYIFNDTKQKNHFMAV